MRADCDGAVVITGAGSGLGRALAQSLARRRLPLALVGRRADRLRATAAACADVAGDETRCLVLPLDVADRAAAEGAIAETLRRWGRIGALINNAAVARFAAIDEAEPRDWELMMRTNLLAPAMFTRLAAPALRESQGVVVNIGSIGGLLALPGRALYGASKAALHHLTRSLARELAPRVRVNAVVPGAIDTELYDEIGLDAEATAQLRAEMIRTTPLGRMGTVADVVPWVELLLGPAGRWVTGSLFVVDGGRSC
jgi:NAD(P)-dependent dehydrogenase (short-subunit alcohol dehydrogenase family)